MEQAKPCIRPLGIPTIQDRIAQTVVKMVIEPQLEPHFHPDSYGYRPGKSAIDAVGVARQRCWRNDWVLDLDVKGFFDSISHELLMKALRRHTQCRWILLYMERWLKAPVRNPDGTEVRRERGTPQGGVVSPVLANLFLHYVFDAWLSRHHPNIPFERYADDSAPRRRGKAAARPTESCLAAQEMRVGPSDSDCRVRVQTTGSCSGTTAGVVSVSGKGGSYPSGVRWEDERE